MADFTGIFNEHCVLQEDSRKILSEGKILMCYKNMHFFLCQCEDLSSPVVQYTIRKIFMFLGTGWTAA